MTKYARPKCYDRKHLIHEKGEPRCNAFTNGIPVEILYGEFIQTRPYPGDGGIQFESILTLKKHMPEVKIKVM